jgi:capsular polysaccharide biosynthesis protein
MQFFTDHQIPILDRARIIDALNQHGLVGAIQAAQQCNLTEIQQAQMLAMLTAASRGSA